MSCSAARRSRAAPAATTRRDAARCRRRDAGQDLPGSSTSTWSARRTRRCRSTTAGASASSAAATPGRATTRGHQHRWRHRQRVLPTRGHSRRRPHQRRQPPRGSLLSPCLRRHREHRPGCPHAPLPCCRPRSAATVGERRPPLIWLTSSLRSDGGDAVFRSVRCSRWCAEDCRSSCSCRCSRSAASPCPPTPPPRAATARCRPRSCARPRSSPTCWRCSASRPSTAARAWPARAASGPRSPSSPASLRRAGWRVQSQPFTFSYFHERRLPALRLGAGRVFKPGSDFTTLTYSGSGAAQGPLRAAGNGCSPGELTARRARGRRPGHARRLPVQSQGRERRGRRRRGADRDRRHRPERRADRLAAAARHAHPRDRRRRRDARRRCATPLPSMCACASTRSPSRASRAT